MLKNEILKIYKIILLALWNCIFFGAIFDYFFAQNLLRKRNISF